MVKVRNMKMKDLDKVARLLAIDYSLDLEKGFIEALKHTKEHLEIVPQHCFVAEADNEVVGVLILHPQKEILEIEDFHVKDVVKNKEAAIKLKNKVLEYLEHTRVDVLCCPIVLKRLITI